jgi:hypothetical protein
VKKHFKEENMFQKTATAAKTENKNKQETKYKQKYKTFGTHAADKRKREETRKKYITAAREKHVRQFKNN